MKRILIMTAALVAAVAVFAAVRLPPEAAALSPAADGTVAGVLHIHSNRSDGRSSLDEIAAAAAKAGLAFIVFADHGDATRVPDAPAYRHGVLCVDGVEISTSGGHYIALDMPASPYPLGGEPRDVIEDVRRLGGFGIVAHPDSPKPALRWREWTAPFDAMEWLNLDTTWRTRAQVSGAKARLRLLAALLDYPLRPAATIASQIGDAGDFRRWEVLTRRRRVALLAGADAHAKLELRNTDPGDNRYSIPFPGYEASFRTMSVHVRTARPLTGNAPVDAGLVLRALRGGHAYTAVDGLATPASFEFTATNALGTVRAGDELGAGGAVKLRARSNAPPGFTTIINQGLHPLVVRQQPDVEVEAPADPAVFWAEVRAPSAPGEPPRRWLVSNPIYVRSAAASAKLPARPAPASSHPLFDGRAIAPWRVEHDAASLAALDLPATLSCRELRMRYALGGGPSAGQFVALAVDVPQGAGAGNHLAVTVRAERAMRISVQLRKPGAEAAGERWQRSIALEPFDQERTIFFDDLMPVGATDAFRPPLAEIRSILFVVDTANTKPGATGRLWIKAAALQR